MKSIELCNTCDQIFDAYTTACCNEPLETWKWNQKIVSSGSLKFMACLNRVTNDRKQSTN